MFGGDGNDDLSGGDGDDEINGGSGDDWINPGTGIDHVSLGDGFDTFAGSVLDLLGDSVTDFSSDDELVLQDFRVARGEIGIRMGSAILDIDSDEDGLVDGSIALEGDFSGGDFMAVSDGNNTVVTYETYLPTLRDSQRVDPTLVNGTNNQAFLTGDGQSDFKVTLRDLGFAGYNNVVGVYEIDASGNIVDTRILFENANADKSAVAGITDVEAGNRLGFFIVQDAADWAATLAAGDTLSFVNGTGAAANISDGSDVSIAVNGAAVDEMVFHSFSEDMNSDGVQHALSGVDVGGQSISVGFEDLTRGGDQDYEDVVLRVEVVDDFVFA